jgi:hypothetical protein
MRKMASGVIRCQLPCLLGPKSQISTRLPQANVRSCFRTADLDRGFVEHCYRAAGIVRWFFENIYPGATSSRLVASYDMYQEVGIYTGRTPKRPVSPAPPRRVCSLECCGYYARARDSAEPQPLPWL